jgi:hypothetical protein
MRRFHQHLAESDAFRKSTWPDKNFRVGNDADDSAQHLTGHAVSGISVDNCVQPPTAQGMVVSVRPECLNKNVDIGKDQRPDIRSSRSLERFRSTPGSVPPEAFETGRRKRAIVAERGSARTVLSPSSISEVNVLPFSAACLFALRKRSSESRIVVRICQSILVRHIYVKWRPNAVRPRPHLDVRW